MMPATAAVQPANHVVRSFTITLQAPAAEATRAFGPIAEQGWDPDWHPQFVYPSPPREIPGAVFRVGDQIWVLRDFDPEQHTVQYVVNIPERNVIVISISLASISARASSATITYEVTALSGAGMPHLQKVAHHLTAEALHWQSAVNAYLQRSRGHP